MPYKIIPPADEADMRKKRYLGHHSVCEKIREIWRIAKAKGDIETQFKCREALGMTKRMHEKLKEFKAYRDSGENHEDPDLKEDENNVN